MLFFDIETRANPLSLQFMEEPSAPSNYKDPEKIQLYIESKKQEQFEKAALDDDYGYIVAIGYQEDDQLIQAITINDMSEKEMIEFFWYKYQKHGGYCCGYNIVGFDFPYLLKRSFDMNIKIASEGQFSQLPNLKRYQTTPICDLMGILYNWGNAKGLKFVAKRYGLDNSLPELDGSQVAEMDNEILKEYVKNDVYLTKQLYDRMLGVYF